MAGKKVFGQRLFLGFFGQRLFWGFFAWQVFVLCPFGLVKRPFERLSDLQPRDQKVTFNHLVQGLKRSFFPWVLGAKSTT